MCYQIRQPKPTTYDEIKVFDYDDKASKHSERKRTFWPFVIVV